VAVVLSPHPDDAALSCGATIAALVAAGERVTVLTCFGGPARPPWSAHAQMLHRLWGDPEDPPAVRAAEDAAACALLGAELVHAGEPDALYRGYLTHEAIFGPPRADDDGAAARLAELAAGSERVLAPLGIGGHVDHRLVRRVGELLAARGHDVWWYEELPYAEVIPLDEPGLHPAPAPPPESEHVARKLEAVRAYRSQRAMLFGDGPVRVSEHERLWVRGTGSGGAGSPAPARARRPRR
jgi:LmbE family N-acetylglucosaminyl deacetylase